MLKMLKTKPTLSCLSIEIILRVGLLCIFCLLEKAPPFHRIIKQEELWLYKHPVSQNEAVTTPLLFVISVGMPIAFIIAYYLATGDKTDLIQALLCVSLTALLTGTIIDVIKLSVGRPRPDFFYRCFPDGHMSPDMQCNGDLAIIEEGRKSFPSGHTGWIFSCFSFISLYLSGKLHCFRPAGRGQGWRLCVVLTPLLAATVIGISRYQDFRHHWDDVVTGAVLGLVIGVVCYHHYYPAVFDANCHCSHASLATVAPDCELGLPHNTSKMNIRQE